MCTFLDSTIVIGGQSYHALLRQLFLFILDLGILVNFRHKETLKQRIQSTYSYLIASYNFMNETKRRK